MTNAIELSLDDRFYNLRVFDPTDEPLINKITVFDELTHTYKRIDTGHQCTSVTTFLKVFEESVDFNQKAYEQAVRLGLIDSDGRYDWKSVILQWNNKRDRAAQFGTLLHNSVENYWLTGSYDSYLAGDYKNTDLDMRFITDEDPQRIKDYLDKNMDAIIKMVVPHCSRQSDESSFSIYPEHRLAFRAKKEGSVPPLLAGTADLVILHEDGKSVSIGDYKTNENLTKAGYSFLKYGFGDSPFSFKNSSLNKYTLQLNLYGAMLKSHGYSIREMFIIWVPSSLKSVPKRFGITNLVDSENDDIRNKFRSNFIEAYANYAVRNS